MKKVYTSKSDQTVWWAVTFSSECKAFLCTESDVLYVKLPLKLVNHTAEEYSVWTGVAHRCGMSHTVTMHNALAGYVTVQFEWADVFPVDGHRSLPWSMTPAVKTVLKC